MEMESPYHHMFEELDMIGAKRAMEE